MSVLEKLKQKQQEKAVENVKQFTKSRNYEVDERFYQLSKDQKGNSNVKIRFVPSLNTAKDDLQYFTIQKVHNVNWYKDPLNEKSEKKYWTGVCPKSVSKEHECPICDYGWSEAGKIERLTGEEYANDPSQILRKKYLREFTNNDKIITNILILKDDINPDNVGKVFLYELKPSIFKSITDEISKVEAKLQEFTSPEERRARNLPENLEVFDAFELTMSKAFYLKYKDKKNHPSADPKHYWGDCYWDDIFTDITNGSQEAWDNLVTSAYCLDEFTTEGVQPDLDFLNKKLNDLTFGKSSGNEVQTQTASVSDKPTEKVSTPVVEAIVQKELPTVSADDLINSIVNEVKTETAPVPKEEPKVEAKQETPVTKSADLDMDAMLAELMNS